MLKFSLESVEDTRLLAQAMARSIKPSDCIALQGTLGAGKTTFMQFLLKDLGVEEDITSPTFMLVHAYQTAFGKCYHLDAYRIEDAAECEELGLDEMLQEGLVCIEWPQIFADWLPKDALWLTFDLQSPSSLRVATLQADGQNETLKKIETAFYDSRARRSD